MNETLPGMTPEEFRRMTENGAKAWAGVDPASLRDGSYPTDKESLSVDHVLDAREMVDPMTDTLRKAVQDVLAHLHDTPTTGYIRDNDASRDAIARLKAVMAVQQEQAGWQPNVIAWAELVEAPIDTPWRAGYEAARNWVAMQIAVAPKQGDKP